MFFEFRGNIVHFVNLGVKRNLYIFIWENASETLYVSHFLNTFFYIGCNSYKIHQIYIGLIIYDLVHPFKIQPITKCALENEC